MENIKIKQNNYVNLLVCGGKISTIIEQGAYGSISIENDHLPELISALQDVMKNNQ